MKRNQNPDDNSSIRVALFQESAGEFKGWVAQCLDFDLVAQGKTMADAQEKFQRTFIGHFCLALKNKQNPFWHCAPENSLAAKNERPFANDRLRKMNIEFSQLRAKTNSPVLA